ncbi:MAG: cryptochrome/photolyase family protein, partial [Bacteroidia bacterium]|nr:cryptochrome/photolyase family protein [Bacteroidia bacterium]
MKNYEAYLVSKDCEVKYIEAISDISDVRRLVPELYRLGFKQLMYIDPVDNWLDSRIKEACINNDLETAVLQSPMFLNSAEQLGPFFKKDKKKYYQTTFYKDQRKRLNVLLENDGKPIGGKWTYDTENRKKYPANKMPPPIAFPDSDKYYEDAKAYVENHFSHHLGYVTDQPLYPTNFKDTQEWFKNFLEERFMEFGSFEDAIMADHSILNHSVLTPMLNVGLILPKDILKNSLAYAEANDIPINSTEGFIRQIIGWREFIRGIYQIRGSDQRKLNYWGFTRKIPPSFYDGTTGIDPVDKTISKILRTGYCHHIERLMVLGNFMLLCEFDPDEVYRWFMELFIDAYDWVMVPNVYGMSQFSDGGLMATKPYISSSNYLMKMSNYKKGEWQDTWDGLFWNFMHKHRDFFQSNPRLSMLLHTFDKMSQHKKDSHLKNAEAFLSGLES